MDIPTILSALGIVATVIFGVWGLYVVIKRRYPGEITLVIDDTIGLFDTIVKNFPDLAVLYKDKPVSHGLVLFKGTLLNSGKKDITPEMVESEIAIELPDGFRWLAAKPITSSSNVKASLAVQSTLLKFTTGLFRCQEYLRFEALAEIPIPEDSNSIESTLVTGLKPTHRIADTGKIRQVSLPPENFKKRRFRNRIIMPCGLLVAGLAITATLFLKGLPAELHFVVPQKDGSTVELEAKPRADGTLLIKNKAADINQNVDVTTFFARTDITPKIVPDPMTKFIIGITLLFYIIIPSGMLFFAYRYQRKWKRLRNQIGLES
jgi:hypothetical protein